MLANYADQHHDILSDALYIVTCNYPTSDCEICLAPDFFLFLKWQISLIMSLLATKWGVDVISNMLINSSCMFFGLE